MLKKISIRWRITLYSALLLTICCILLTGILNLFAFRMADSIEAVQLAPAQSTSSGENTPQESIPMDITEMYLLPPSEITQNAKSIFRYQSLLYMLIIIGGGTVLTYYVIGKSLQPLQKLNIQVKNMTVSHLAETLSVTDANDEIAALTHSFNEMTDKLNEAFLMQQRFSANAAHELRTPLAVLQTKIDVFKKSSSHTAAEYDALISVFEKQVRRLRSLVKTLLDMTNINDDVEYYAVHLKDIFEDIVVELTPIAQKYKVSLHLQCDDHTVTGNLDLLYQAFYNLVENGIKYNKENGSVTVTVKKMQDGKAEILIRDTGIGIPNEMKKQIFEPFFRVDKSRSRAMGGAGIGLAITERIILKHHGSITVSNNEVGGTCFQIVL
ncbi:MAG: sensor histidine kinase [Catenibacillus sp.]